MERVERIKKERRALQAGAYERWKGYQPNTDKVSQAQANRDGTLPRPKVGEVTPEQRARFENRERERIVFDSTAFRMIRRAAERQIGATLDFVDLPPNEQALKAGRPVVRVVTLPGAGLVPQGFATGFLVAPNLLLTNHHVFRGADEAEGVGAQFLFERTHEGLREGLIFECDPARFFVNDKGLDYAIVALKETSVSGAPLDQFKFLPLIAAKGKIRKGDPVSIIQHPAGRPKQYATVNNRLLDLRDDGFLLYETDTLEGSSGSPVFNEHWEVIGLHHSGVPQIEGDKLVKRDGSLVPLDTEVADDDLIWVANEGIRVSALVESLAAHRFDDPAKRKILADLCATTLDPLKLVAENSPVVVNQVPTTAGALPAQETAMSQNLFHITGPTTFHITSSVPAPAERVTSKPAEALPPAIDVPFREKSLKFDERYDKRDAKGYRADFLQGWNVPHPSTNGDHVGEILTAADGKPWVIPYYHYSLVMNSTRRLLSWAASNVDYTTAARKFTKSRKEYGGENWRLDPRVATAKPGLQLEDADFYQPARKIDRGHIVRREDGAWGGAAAEAEFGNSDTYHWTNCTPQSEAFNQSGKDGIWGAFEEHIQREVRAEGGRMTIFAGPVLSEDDPVPESENADAIQVPMEYWKVVLCVAKENGVAVKRSYGFVFDQTTAIKNVGFGLERMDMTEFDVFQMPVKDISKKTGVTFDASVLAADVLKDGGANESIRGFSGKRLRSLQNVVLR